MERLRWGLAMVMPAALCGESCATGLSATELLSNRHLLSRAAFDLTCPAQP
jgi:hypothetical protein